MKDVESLGILQGDLVFGVVRIVVTLMLEFNFNEVDKVLCVVLDDVGMVDGERDNGDLILLLLECHLCKGHLSAWPLQCHHPQMQMVSLLRGL